MQYINNIHIASYIHIYIYIIYYIYYIYILYGLKVARLTYRVFHTYHSTRNVNAMHPGHNSTRVDWRDMTQLWEKPLWMTWKSRKMKSCEQETCSCMCPTIHYGILHNFTIYFWEVNGGYLILDRFASRMLLSNPCVFFVICPPWFGIHSPQDCSWESGTKDLPTGIYRAYRLPPPFHTLWEVKNVTYNLLCPQLLGICYLHISLPVYIRQGVAKVKVSWNYHIW